MCTHVIKSVCRYFLIIDKINGFIQLMGQIIIFRLIWMVKKIYSRIGHEFHCIQCWHDFVLYISCRLYHRVCLENMIHLLIIINILKLIFVWTPWYKMADLILAISHEDEPYFMSGDKRFCSFWFDYNLMY